MRRLGRLVVVGYLAAGWHVGCISLPETEPNGACLATCTGCDRLCFENESRDRCRERPASSFEVEKTCDALGYTKVCSDDGRVRARPGVPCPTEEL